MSYVTNIYGSMPSAIDVAGACAYRGTQVATTIAFGFAITYGVPVAYGAAYVAAMAFQNALGYHAAWLVACAAAASMPYFTQTGLNQGAIAVEHLSHQARHAVMSYGRDLQEKGRGVTIRQGAVADEEDADYTWVEVSTAPREARVSL